MPTGLLSRFVRAFVVLVVLAPVVVVVPAGSASAAGVSIRWARHSSGFVQPTQVTGPRDGTGRVFVVEKAGRIRIFSGGRILATPYLDIRSLVKDDGEGGLFSVAFHPQWKTHPYIWVNYVNTAGDVRVSRFKAARYTSNSVSPATRYTIFDVPHPDQFTNHFGGQVVFGPDGYLYISTGDGGGSGDPNNVGQNTSSLMGKILRLNVIGAQAACGANACVPPGNPYAGSVPGHGAIWATGARNPWRFSFDPATGVMWIGDVGQGRQEEVSRIPAGAGGANLGWSCREGRLIFKESQCRAGTTYTNPVFVYGRSFGNSITGGFIYRGVRYRGILGARYIGGDFGSGRIFYGYGSSIRAAGSLPGVTSFGEVGARELWAVTINGGLYRMVAVAT